VAVFFRVFSHCASSVIFKDISLKQFAFNLHVSKQKKNWFLPGFQTVLGFPHVRCDRIVFKERNKEGPGGHASTVQGGGVRSRIS